MDIGGATPPQRTEFGSAVAIRDGFAFIGMPFALTTGRDRIFSQTTSGWVRTGTLTASDKTSGDGFGRAVCTATVWRSSAASAPRTSTSA